MLNEYIGFNEGRGGEGGGGGYPKQHMHDSSFCVCAHYLQNKKCEITVQV